MNSYTSHSTDTDPGRFASAIGRIVPGIDPTVETVRGLLVHDAFLHLYDLSESDFETVSRATLPVEARLEQLFGRTTPGTIAPRPVNQRQIGTCRDYALLTCGFLRTQGVPARLRCGFATYFGPNKHEDHWICEFWSEAQNQWLRIDAELDQDHRNHFDITFDTLNVPRNAFLTAPEVWELMEAGHVKDAEIGHGTTTGKWFAIVNVVRDRLALSDQVTSTWDRWRDAKEGQMYPGAEWQQLCQNMALEINSTHHTPNEFTKICPPEPFWMPAP